MKWDIKKKGNKITIRPNIGRTIEFEDISNQEIIDEVIKIKQIDIMSEMKKESGEFFNQLHYSDEEMKLTILERLKKSYEKNRK